MKLKIITLVVMSMIGFSLSSFAITNSQDSLDKDPLLSNTEVNDNSGSAEENESPIDSSLEANEGNTGAELSSPEASVDADDAAPTNEEVDKADNDVSMDDVSNDASNDKSNAN